MRHIFKAHSKTAVELFFLETAKIPIRFIISKRRLMYYWHIMRQNENELIKKVYDVQRLIHTKNDWYQLIVNEKEKYEIELSDEEVSKLSKFRFKRLVDKKVNTFAFQYLKEKASSHSKSTKILEENENKSMMKRPAYLKNSMLLKADCQLLFQLRSKMLDVKSNFSNLYNNDTTCRTCRKAGIVEDEEHLLQCESLCEEIEVSDVHFDWVYGDIEKQMTALKAFKAVLRKREFLLEYRNRLFN